MTHFYWTRKQLDLLLKQRTDEWRADIAMGNFRDIEEFEKDFQVKTSQYAKV